MLSKSHTKYIQSLQHKKFRDESGLFIAEGPKLVADLLRDGNFKCREIFSLPEWIDENTTLAASHTGTAITEVKEHELQKLSALTHAHQVLAVFEQAGEDRAFDPSGKIALVLDTIQDPGNMGTLIRIADWFGISHIICSTDSADCYNPKVVQGTMGSLGRVHIIYTDLVSFLTGHRDITAYATAMDGESISGIEKIKEGFIIIGNEGRGISEAVLQCSHKKISIPRTGQAESLNAAVAAAIIISNLKNW